MAIQDDKTILSKQDLKEYHNRILPYLGGNMMMSTNNSDYYSTDEKVVGVWTDGKPIYQKIFTGTTPTVTSTYAYDYTSLGININEIVDSRMILKFGSGSMQVIDCSGAQSMESYSTSSSIEAGIKYTINSNSHSQPNTLYIMNKSTNYSATPYVLVLQYTKTTDTTSTALTTPGAYDINFPNTWPANKEIFFGNGLYGYRATGNFTATSTGSSFTLNLVANAANFTIVNTGGSAKVTNAANSTVMRMFGVNWSQTDGKPTTVILIDRGTNNYLRFQVMFITDKATTSDTYDVWVTYTK